MESTRLGKKWDSEALDVCRSIKQAICVCVVNQKQCFVLLLLADCIERYVDSWVKISCPEIESNRTAKLGKELLTILENGLQLINLCDGKDFLALVLTILGCKGQLSEIIDDARRYIQMINRFILAVVKSLPDAEKQLDIEKLMLEVEFKLACEVDRKAMMHNPNFHFHFVGGWSKISKPNPAVPILIQVLRAETDLNILDSDLLIKQRLGRGAFGDVHGAMWHKLPVAVKTFKSNERLYKDELDCFKKMLLHNNSSHIIQMLGHTRGNKLVLELMENDLQGYMTTNPQLPLIQSIDLMLQIAKAMRDLHSIGLVHRDLKPSNLLVNFRKYQSPLIKLADFGIAKVNFETAKANTSMQGTLFYMAPEVLDGRNYSRKVDVYSFGLTCVEILTWGIRQPKEKGERPILPAFTPTKLESLVQSCMEYNDEKRPSFQDICHNLWLVKEETLVNEVNTLAVELKITIDGQEGMWVEKVAHASAIHPGTPFYVPPLYPETSNSNSQMVVSHDDVLPAEIVVSNIVHPNLPPHSTSTSKRVIYVFRQEKFLRGLYSVKDIAIDIMTDIRLNGILDVEPSGKVKMLDPWTTLENPFVGMGVDPQNRQGEEHPPEDRGLFGQFKKLLRDQGKKFNLSLQIGGWDHSKYFSMAFSSERTRTAFVDSIVELLRMYPIFNGLVIDWRLISDNGKNYGKPGNATDMSDVDNLVLVLEALRKELPVASFMIALTCTPFATQRWKIEKIIHLVDQIEILMPSPKRDVTGHPWSLYHSAYSQNNIDEAVQMYILSHGIPSSKIFIRASLLGYGFGDTDGMGMPACEANDTIYNRLSTSQEKWDDEAKAAYSHNPVTRVVYSYDNVRSIIEKAKYVKENGLGGILIYDGPYDFPPDHERSIAKALHDQFR